MIRRKIAVVAAVTAVTTVLTGGVAAAVWSVLGTGSGGAQARSLIAATFAPGQGASALGDNVTITWTNGANPTGTTYQVVRNSTPASTLSCTASPCNDNGAPTGTYTYTVRPKLQGWSGPSATTGNVVVAPLAVQTGSPSTPDLVTADDTGISGTDNITNKARPQFTGTAAANALVRLYRNGAEIGSQQLSGGATSWTISPAADIAEGNNVPVTATAQVSGQLASNASAALNVTFDRTAPSAPSITSPANNATGVPRNAALAGTAGEAGGTVSISVVRTSNNAAISTTPTAVPGPSSPFGWNTNTLANNTYFNNAQHRAVATHADAAGNVSPASAAVLFTTS